MMKQFVNPEISYFYEMMDDYFDSPILYKMEEIDDTSIYVIQIKSMLLNEKRYIILFCRKDNFAIGSGRPMKEIGWYCLQCRTLEKESYETVPKHFFVIKREPRFSLELKLHNRNEKISIYECPKIPFLEISMLHTKNMLYEYPEEGNLLSALETYQTILHIKT